jgi:hypothetical protein
VQVLLNSKGLAQQQQQQQQVIWHLWLLGVRFQVSLG